jgi:DNA-directed RNA polymerase specialized sigma24 family protein
MVRVYRSIGSFRFQSSFTTWLFQIVKNTFLDGTKRANIVEGRKSGDLSDP